MHVSSRPARQEGRAHVTNARRDAVDAGSRLTMAWTSVRQNRVVLAPVAGVKLQDSLKLRSVSGNDSDGVNKNSSPGRARHKP